MTEAMLVPKSIVIVLFEVYMFSGASGLGSFWVECFLGFLGNGILELSLSVEGFGGVKLEDEHADHGKREVGSFIGPVGFGKQGFHGLDDFSGTMHQFLQKGFDFVFSMFFLQVHIRLDDSG